MAEIKCMKFCNISNHKHCYTYLCIFSQHYFHFENIKFFQEGISISPFLQFSNLRGACYTKALVSMFSNKIHWFLDSFGSSVFFFEMDYLKNDSKVCIGNYDSFEHKIKHFMDGGPDKFMVCFMVLSICCYRASVYSLESSPKFEIYPWRHSLNFSVSIILLVSN